MRPMAAVSCSAPMKAWGVFSNGKSRKRRASCDQRGGDVSAASSDSAAAARTGIRNTPTGAGGAGIGGPLIPLSPAPSRAAPACASEAPPYCTTRAIASAR